MATITETIGSVISITLETIGLSRYVVDIVDERVIVFIDVYDNTGRIYETREFTFWATMPETMEILDETDPNNPIPFDPPQYEPTPEEWFVLPATDIISLITQAQGILSAVKNRSYS